MVVINRSTGEVRFLDGLHIAPHSTVGSLVVDDGAPVKVTTQPLSLRGWKRHILGFRPSDHGRFEVEALSGDEDRIQVVLLAHDHSFYEPDTPDDAERRAFHEGIIHRDLAGQREFSWGEVVCRLERPANKDWLLIAYSRGANVPLTSPETLWSLFAREISSERNA